MQSETTIYRLCSEWEAAQLLAEGRIPPNADDVRDGFLHFSTREQVPGTAAKHYAHVPDLRLLVVDVNMLGDMLKWETSRGGALFPHVYGDVVQQSVRAIHEVPRTDGKPHFTDEMFA